MTDKMDIRESETGLVRVFHLDLPAEAIERYVTEAGTGEWPLKYGLGATKLSSSFVDVVDLRDLGQMPLTTYLHEAYTVPDAELSQDAARLNGLRGHVLILPSQAFARTAQTVMARTPLKWVGTYGETRGRGAGAAVRSKSAKRSNGARSTGGKGGAGMSPGMVRWVVIGVGLVILAAVAVMAVGGGTP